MSLSLYNKKRHFDETPEPKGKEKHSKNSLKFVVQKHDASHVHYDFRLEMEGVLKSWAIPKGPSLNPSDKRLAMMVEDHPYDYRDFEGIIPAGNYGGGTVIVWDEGTYEPLNAEGLSKKEQEKLLLKQLYSGNLKIILHGKKLNGEFALFQMKSRGERSWILVKKKDDFSSDTDITKNNKSAKTGKTLAEVAKENGTEVNHPEYETEKKEKQPPIQLLNETGRLKNNKTSKKKAPESADLKAKLNGYARKTKMPQDITPMLATLIDEPFDNSNWLYEIKWDGYRAVAYINNNTVELISRNHLSFTVRYQPIAEALKKMNTKAVFDGEIVAVNEKGLADFQLLQNWQNAPVKLQYYIFDILWADGYDLTKLPLIERKKILKDIIPEDEIIRYSDHVIDKGIDFFNVALKKGLEGIMAKKCSSIYIPGQRTKEWLKIKVNLRQEVVIAGYTEPRNTRKYFGSLLLGVYDGDELVYVGHTGSGFTAKSLEQIYKKLQPLVTNKSPFTGKTKTNMPATWVKPKLVCEIKFTEWTKDRMARHPIFMGLRSDKKATDVSFEKATNMASLKKNSGTLPKKSTTKPSVKSTVKAYSKKAQKKNTVSKSLKTFIDLSSGEDQVIVVDKHELKLTNLNKLYWKKEKFSKADMLNYYEMVSEFMLPYMMDRPQSLNRHPNGIDGPSFFQKDVKGKVPSWMQTFTYFSESTNEDVEYLVCSDKATLLYMANLGCIEMHPWHSRVQKPDNPDWCLIDLDPDKTNTFNQVIETANIIKKVLDDVGAESFVKTSGSSGIHILLPLGAKYSYDQSKQLAQLIVSIAHEQLSDTTSLERNPSKRKGKIYLDFLQNRSTQTAAAPYSLRPKPGVPVSTPLHWSEVKKGLTPTTYNAMNIAGRLKAEGDLFKGLLGKGINLEKVLKNVQSLMQ
ncbi:MAG TPA: DNA ligase D [Flavisolibacter sp.]|nr:DNA ligase D [Flavisolibacter sp.]